MSPFDVQSIVYICIGIDTEIAKLQGEVVGDRVFDGGYECADRCPGGMYDTTYWVMTCAFPVLEQAANGREQELAASEWLYLVCEEFGQDIIKYVKETGLWPYGNTLEDIAKAAVDEVIKLSK